jgi:hypothetical protein
MQCLYAIRDYDRLKKEVDDIIHSSPDRYTTYLDTINGEPTECRAYNTPGSVAGDPTQDKVIRIEAINERCGAVERALARIPGEYRKGVLDNIMYGVGYPVYAHRTTYSRWRSRLLYHVAKNSGLV